MAGRSGAKTGAGGRGRRRGSVSGMFWFLLVIVVVGGCGLAAVVSWRQAAALCTYDPADSKVTTAQTPIWERLWSGEPVPKPQVSSDPGSIGERFEVERFGTAPGVELEAWRIRRDNGPGVVMLFGDHGVARDALLPEAKALVGLGWEVLLLEGRRAGGSVGGEMSLGWHESEDVRAAYERERLRTDHAVVLFGRGVGAAAILRAVQDAAITPTALILDRPFDSLRTRLRAHFSARGLPPIPLATIATFWVGVLRGLPAFEFAPSAWAAEARMPALVLADGGDRAGATAAKAVHDNLAGTRQWYRFDRRPGEMIAAQWQAKVGAHLAAVVKGSPTQPAVEAIDPGVTLPGARPPVASSGAGETR